MAQKFSRTQLARYVAESDKPNDELAKEVAAFLVDTGKVSDLDSLMRDVMEYRGSHDGVVELTARSAYPLTSETRSEINGVAKRLYPNATEIIIHEEHDAEVIGGVNLQFAHASLDLTIQSKLHSLREAIK